jgi:hypothetical protein
MTEDDGAVYASPVGTPWMWILTYGHHDDRTPTHGYEATRQAAMQAFARRPCAGPVQAFPSAAAEATRVPRSGLTSPQVEFAAREASDGWHQ